MIAWLLALALAEPVPFDELARTLSDESGGAIRPVEGVAHPDAYEVIHSSPAVWLASPERPPWEDQGVFEFDVQAWLDHTGDPDFLASKVRFYSQLDFLSHEQVHERPYPYMAAWQELFHPPIQSLDHPLETYSDVFGPERPDTSDAAWFQGDFQRDIDARSGTELTRGNTVQMLDSDVSFEEKLRMVREAKERMYVSVMFFGCDETSDALAEAMKERAAAGVDVRLLTEGVYRRSLGERCADRLIAGGVKVASAGAALHLANSPQAVLHYKVWIRDGEELIEGGANILDYENKGTGYNFFDRDTDLHVVGPMVTDAEEGFLLAWDQWSDQTSGDRERLDRLEEIKQAQRDRGYRGAEHYDAWLADPEQRTDGLCRIAMQGLMAERQPIAPMVEAHLAATKHQVVMVSPAMFDEEHDPESRIGRLMALLHDRKEPTDPRVVILTNGRGGASGELGVWLLRHGWFNRLEGRRAWSNILFQFMEMTRRRASIRNRTGALAVLERNPRVEVWMYFQHLHTKTWLFDREVTVVGSWNLDKNSADNNYEQAVVCMDSDLRDAMERDFTDALINAIPVVSANGR